MENFIEHDNSNWEDLPFTYTRENEVKKFLNDVVFEEEKVTEIHIYNGFASGFQQTMWGEFKDRSRKYAFFLCSAYDGYEFVYDIDHGLKYQFNDAVQECHQRFLHSIVDSMSYGFEWQAFMGEVHAKENDEEFQNTHFSYLADVRHEDAMNAYYNY